MPDRERSPADPRLPGPAPEAVRQLVVCCDGTGSTLTGGQRDTNVLCRFEPLAGESANQRLHDDPGVGSPDGLPATGPLEPLTQMIERAVSLAIGRGICENIGQACLFFCREYERGDPVYLLERPSSRAFAHVRWGTPLPWIGSLGSAAKGAGLAGVLILALLGWRGRRQPERQATLPGAGSPARS